MMIIQGTIELRYNIRSAWFLDIRISTCFYTYNCGFDFDCSKFECNYIISLHGRKVACIYPVVYRIDVKHIVIAIYSYRYLCT